MGKHIQSSNLSVIHLPNVKHKSVGCYFVATLLYCWIGNKKAYFLGGLHFLIQGTLKIYTNQML